MISLNIDFYGKIMPFFQVRQPYSYHHTQIQIYKAFIEILFQRYIFEKNRYFVHNFDDTILIVHSGVGSQSL